MHHREPARNPFVHQRARDARPVCLIHRRHHGPAWFRIGAQLLLDVPVHLAACGAGIVRTRPVHDRDLQALGFGLPRTRDVDVHPVWLAVAVGVEIRFHPQILPDPRRRVLKGGHSLRHAIHEHRSRPWRTLRGNDARDAGEHDQTCTNTQGNGSHECAGMGKQCLLNCRGRGHTAILAECRLPYLHK